MKTKMKIAILTNFEGFHGIRTTIDACRQGGSLLDAIEAGVREVESSPLATTVGFGGAPNALGEMELDAAIMNGNTLQTGSVGALKGFRHPVSVARQVMERLPHVMLVGAGATRFAAEVGAEPGDSLSDDARKKYHDWAVKRGLSQDTGTGRSPLLDRIWKERREDIALGTTVFLAFSETEGMAGATSTSGWAYKYPGRLGDSSIIGAGLYVDSRYGGAACTHTGEMTIRAATARSIVIYMKKGASVQDACYEALDDLRSLQGGFRGPVMMHAMDSTGSPFVLSAGYEKGAKTNPYCYWNDGMSEIVKPVSKGEPY